MAEEPGHLPGFGDLFLHSPDGNLILDAGPKNAGLIVDINPRAAEMLRGEPEELRGQNISKYLVSERDWPASLAKAALNHGIAWDDQLEARGGEQTLIHATASGFRGPKGAFVLMTLQAGPQESTEAAGPLSFISELKGFDQSVLNIVAHEFRTPLTPILIQVFALERNLAPFLDSDDRKSFRIIHRNIERIEASVHAVMTEAAARIPAA